MGTKLLAELLILCGALHDISEKAREEIVQKQVSDVEKRIEGLTWKYFPATMIKIKNNG